MPGGTFPTSTPSYPTISVSETFVTQGSIGHRQTHLDEETDITALAAKLGSGASTAAANQVLRGTGAGASAFGQVATGDIAANAVTQVGYASVVTANPSTTSTTYVAIPDLSVVLTTLASAKCTVEFTGILQSTVGGSINAVAVFVDGVRSGPHFYVSGHATGNALVSIAASVLVTGLSAAAHTVTMRWLAGVSSTLTMYDIGATMIVTEIRR